MEADMRNKFLAMLALSAALTASIAMSQNVSRSPPADLTLGDVNFPISCSDAAQRQFNRAVAILHSFWYEEAEKAFTRVTETDAACAMGYWGVAMTNWHPLWYPPNSSELEAGSNAVAKARDLGGKTDRERAYIEAIGAFYWDNDTLDNRTRSIAYERAMEQVYLRYPDDREGAIFYALALNATALPADKTYANQKKAAEILNKIFLEQPNHPGIAHYLIHSYDSAPLAALGLPAAICYAKIAPSVPHALHMPSHIFTRLGKWQDSVEANRSSLSAGQDYALRQYGEGVAWDQSLHAMDYLEYAYLQLGEDRVAKQLVDEIADFRRAASKSLAAAYAIAAIPARYAVERRDWLQAANLSPPTLAFDWDGFPWAKAMITYARALGAARIGDVASAQIEIEHLQAAHDSLIGRDRYWADQIEVQRLAATAMLAHAQGKDEQALAGLRHASDLEASMDKHPVTPGGIVPTRELLGDLLLEVNQPAQALIAYEQTLSTDPNRFRSVYGAAKAADQTGDLPKARAYYQQLALLGAHADTERPELAEARVYLAR
jgi:tetratricopeptide (TPR) repeat protein